ncbi:MAG: AAA family ATPase, partial [Elusimicrobiota bacterium]
RKANFRHAFIIMTSNIGSKAYTAKSMGFLPSKAANVRSELLRQVKRHIKPELYNRIDEVVVFQTLDKSQIRQILELELAKLAKRVKDANGIDLEISPEAKQLLAEEGFDEQYGARPLRRAIGKYLEAPLAEAILKSKSLKTPVTKIFVSRDPDDEHALSLQASPKPADRQPDLSAANLIPKKEGGAFRLAGHGLTPREHELVNEAIAAAFAHDHGPVDVSPQATQFNNGAAELINPGDEDYAFYDPQGDYLKNKIQIFRVLLKATEKGDELWRDPDFPKDLFVHHGRKKRRVYYSITEILAMPFLILTKEERGQIARHEIAHINNPEKSEEEIEAFSPVIGLQGVIAQWAMPQALRTGPITILNIAANEILKTMASKNPVLARKYIALLIWHFKKVRPLMGQGPVRLWADALAALALQNPAFQKKVTKAFLGRMPHLTEGGEKLTEITPIVNFLDIMTQQDEGLRKIIVRFLIRRLALPSEGNNAGVYGLLGLISITCLEIAPIIIKALIKRLPRAHGHELQTLLLVLTGAIFGFDNLTMGNALISQKEINALVDWDDRFHLGIAAHWAVNSIGQFQDKATDYLMKAFSGPDKKQAVAAAWLLSFIAQKNPINGIRIIKSFMAYLPRAHEQQLAAIGQALATLVPQNEQEAQKWKQPWVRPEHQSFWKRLTSGWDCGLISPVASLRRLASSGRWFHGRQDKIQRRMPTLARILSHPNKLGKFIFALSQLRALYPYYLEMKSELPPIEWARKNNVIFKLGELSIVPVSGSFRRHIIYVEDEEGMFAVEIKIPGEHFNRKDIGRAHFEATRQLWERYHDNPGVVKPIYFTKLLGSLSLYGERFDYSANFPLGVMLFEYEEGKRIGPSFEAYLNWLVNQRPLRSSDFVDPKIEINHLKRQITADMALNAFRLHRLGWWSTSNHDGITDMHPDNFRVLARDGHAQSVGDFGISEKTKLTMKERRQEMRHLLGNLSPSQRNKIFSTVMNQLDIDIKDPQEREEATEELRQELDLDFEKKVIGVKSPF